MVDRPKCRGEVTRPAKHRGRHRFEQRVVCAAAVRRRFQPHPFPTRSRHIRIVQRKASEAVRQALTIGDRKGEFPGMLKSRIFQVVFAGENHGSGITPEDKPDKRVQYSGKEISVTP